MAALVGADMPQRGRYQLSRKRSNPPLTARNRSAGDFAETEPRCGIAAGAGWRFSSWSAARRRNRHATKSTAPAGQRRWMCTNFGHGLFQRIRWARSTDKPAENRHLPGRGGRVRSTFREIRRCQRGFLDLGKGRDVVYLAGVPSRCGDAVPNAASLTQFPEITHFIQYLPRCARLAGVRYVPIPSAYLSVESRLFVGRNLGPGARADDRLRCRR